MTKMKYLGLIILSELDRLEELLAKLVLEVKVTGVTTFPSRGISSDTYSQFVTDFSVGGALSRLFESRKHEDRVLMVALRDDEELARLKKALSELFGTMEEKGTANFLVLPVLESIGFDYPKKDPEQNQDAEEKGE